MFHLCVQTSAWCVRAVIPVSHPTKTSTVRERVANQRKTRVVCVRSLENLPVKIVMEIALVLLKSTNAEFVSEGKLANLRIKVNR